MKTVADVAELARAGASVIVTVDLRRHHLGRDVLAQLDRVDGVTRVSFANGRESVEFGATGGRVDILPASAQAMRGRRADHVFLIGGGDPDYAALLGYLRAIGTQSHLLQL